MNTVKQTNENFARRPHGYEAMVGLLGAVAGAGLGAAVAGPAGALVGLIVGAAMGAGTGWIAADRARVDSHHDLQLDRSIGVTEGDIGAPGLEHPPARIGALSKEASGASSSEPDAAPAEGPFGRSPR